MATARCNGLDIEYEDRGEGEPLLLIMGLGAQLIYWPDDFWKGLLERGYRVIRYDARDVGLSSKISGARSVNIRKLMLKRLFGQPMRVPYLLEDMADDAAALLDRLDIRHAHIFGVSMGGFVAQTLAIRHPQRVATLTSVMSHTGQRRYLAARPDALRVLLSAPPRNRQQAVARTLRFYRTVGSRGFPLDTQALSERAGRAYDRCFYPVGFARHMAAILASGSRAEALRQVTAPTLVLHGSDDPLIRPVGGRATAAAVPGAQFSLIEGMGHDLPRGAWPQIFEQLSALTARVPCGPVSPSSEAPRTEAPRTEASRTEASRTERSEAPAHAQRSAAG